MQLTPATSCSITIIIPSQHIFLRDLTCGPVSVITTHTDQKHISLPHFPTKKQIKQP